MPRIATGFIAYLPGLNSDLSAKRESIAHFAKEADLLVVKNRPYVLACVGSDAGNRGAPANGDSFLIDVFTGTAAACESRIVSSVDTKMKWDTIHDLLGASVQVYNALELKDDLLRLESDFLGMKPVYVAKSDGGLILASSLRMLHGVFPETLNGGDELGLSEFLLFGTPFFERTLHRGIARLETGSRLEWRNGSATISRSRRFLPPPVESDLSMPEAVRCIREETTNVFAKRLEYARTPLALGLSGGFDSRFLAALASDRNLALRAYSYGQPHHTEIMAAQAVARQLKLAWTLLPYDADSIFNGLPIYLEHVEGQADLMMSQMLNLMQIKGEPGSTLLHGFLGDALSGAHLEWLCSPRPRTRDEVASDVVSHRSARSNVNGRTVCEVAGLKTSLDDVKHHIASNLPSDAQAHQMLMLFDCENRQRRSVGSQLAMLGSRFHVIAPSYDSNVFAVYFRLPRITLDDRFILKQLFARCWPALAEIPHAEEWPPIVPRIRTMLPFALREFRHVMAGKIIGSERYDRLRRRWRDPYLWRMSYGNASTEHAERIRDRISESITALNDVFGIHLNEQDLSTIAPFPGCKVEPHFVRRLFGLAEYVQTIEAQRLAKAQLCSV